MQRLFFFMLVLISPLVFAQDSKISYMPESNLTQYIYDQLDLSTFRNSLGPRRTHGQRHFSEFGLKPSKLGNHILVIETDDWSYEIEILNHADINRDNIVDLEVCFRDKSKTATYKAQKPLLLSQLEKGGALLALNFQVFGCEEYAH